MATRRKPTWRQHQYRIIDDAATDFALAHWTAMCGGTDLADRLFTEFKAKMEAAQDQPTSDSNTPVRALPSIEDFALKGSEGKKA